MTSNILSVITLYGDPAVVMGGQVSCSGGTSGTRRAMYPAGVPVFSYSTYLHAEKNSPVFGVSFLLRLLPGFVACLG